MSSRVQMLSKKGLAHPPKWLPHNVHYEVQTGSVSYGVSSDNSDFDVVGFCIPPKEDIFPHLKGEIPGFGSQIKRFEQYQEYHIMDAESKIEYDLTIYSIVKFFQLCMENNPNMTDSLFVPQRCILYISDIGQMVRDNRKLFLHKGAFHKFRGYAFKSISNIEQKKSSENPKRAADISEFGYSTKFAYHVLRLALECEQILEEGDLDLEKNREILKSVRRGEWTFEQIKDWFSNKERHLDDLYQKSTLQHKPDEGKIKELLMNCLEHHYGSIQTAVSREVGLEKVLRDFREVLEKYEK